MAATTYLRSGLTVVADEPKAGHNKAGRRAGDARGMSHRAAHGRHAARFGVDRRAGGAGRCTAINGRAACQGFSRGLTRARLTTSTYKYLFHCYMKIW